MDVQRRRRLLEERIREDTHVAIERDGVEIVAVERVQDASFVVLPGLVVAPDHGFGWNPAFLCFLDDGCILGVGEHDGERRAARGAVGDVHEVSAAVRSHAGEFHA